MNSLNYLLQTNLYLTLFLGFYMLVLRNETFFKQNRIFLNGSVLLSFLIPFINSGWFRELFITQKVREATTAIPLQLIYDPVIVGEESPKWTAEDILIYIYLAGVALFLIRLLVQLIWLNYNLKEKRGVAFSFFKALVVDEGLKEKETIINHEKVHIRQWHSIDVILIELAAVINWFNPVMYIYKKEIKHIHEFIADEEAASLRQSKSDYALLLLSNTLGVDPHQLSNSFFNQSLLKRRILMLSKERSRTKGLLKYGLSAPLFAVMLIFSAATVPNKTALIIESKKITNSLISSLTQNEESDPYRSFLNRNPTVKELAWKIKPYRVIVHLKNGTTETYNMDVSNEKVAAISKYGEFPYPPPPPPIPSKVKEAEIPPGAAVPSDDNVVPPSPAVPEEPAMDTKNLGQFFSKNITYPASARESNVTGLVVAGFRVANNSITDIKILKSPGHGLEEEVTRVFSKYEGPINLKDGDYTTGVIFKLTGVPDNSQADDLNEFPNYLGKPIIVVGYSKDYNASVQDDIKDFASVERLPEFPGGEKGFGTFLSRNIKYPELARANKITGRVFVSFVVEKNGELSGIKVLRGLGYGTDEEAVRVLKISPKWIPGMQNGRPVRVQYTIPISFQQAKKADIKSQLQNIPPRALYIADGKKINQPQFKKIDPASIKTVNVLKGNAAETKYGKKGENGVIEIFIKNATPETF